MTKRKTQTEKAESPRQVHSPVGVKSNPTKMVKVQVPLNGHGPALIYDQAREHVQTRSLGGHETAMMKDEPRAFFHAHWAANDIGWILLKRVPEQGW
jgi:hypothetical protein